MKATSTITQPISWSGSGFFAQKVTMAASVLAEARRVAERADFGPLLNQLIGQAWEFLDDLDEILVTLDPVCNGRDFATAAALHRELEQVHAAIPTRRRAVSARQASSPR